MDQLAIRFAQYHLYVMTPAHDNRMNVGAKGLSGEAYKGHTFWDTEMDIRKYLKLIINVVIINCIYELCASRRFTPANWPALVRFVKETNTAAHNGKPDLTAVSPNAMDTEM